MKLDHRRTILVGLAFLSICAFWQMYDSVIPKILTETFRLNETLSGAIMALDNILALFLLPLIVIFPLIFGIDGVMYAGPIADAATAIVCGFFTLRELRELTQLQKQQTAAA